MPSISQLPPEIREQIWLHTFSQRTLHLNLHARKKALTQLKRLFRLTKFAHLAARKTRTAVSFSASEGPVDAQTFQRRQAEFNYLSKEEMHPRTAVPLAPVALSVCRGSRALALKRYQRAFAGRVWMPIPMAKRV
jgi:hypothetical protein